MRVLGLGVRGEVRLGLGLDIYIIKGLYFEFTKPDYSILGRLTLFYFSISTISLALFFIRIVPTFGISYHITPVLVRTWTYFLQKSSSNPDCHTYDTRVV